MILSFLGLATFSPARKDLFLGAHGATSQGVTYPGIAPASNSLNFGVPTNPKPVSSQKASPRVAQRTGPTPPSKILSALGWADAPSRICSGELTEQLPRVVTHPGIAPASNSLNFGVPTNPKPVSSQEASSKLGASHT
ncbi:hypothetical protein L3X38_023000 [Prunus dulcis]|uniref:Uncharacterized protein n=1 Tax=Prunus dulcis TaxID=3755 RepID=A0AAD4Z4X0_PRUDU|nr:hypothetical protein L3X38_023000 [Prunus dulcis]